jgi:HlyD family secretion protein
MITPKVKTAFLVALNAGVLAASLAVSVPNIHAQAPTRAAASDAAEDKRWLAVAPGRVEPLSGIIRVAVPVMGVIGEVLVKANDKVFAGEPQQGIRGERRRATAQSRGCGGRRRKGRIRDAILGRQGRRR